MLSDVGWDAVDSVAKHLDSVGMKGESRDREFARMVRVLRG